MKVKRIYPCVCINHKPDNALSTYYGMPELRVVNSDSGKEFWQIRCPRCHRGGLKQFRSQYYALKDWNEMQVGLWQNECCDFWSGKPLENCPEWRMKMYEEMKKNE